MLLRSGIKCGKNNKNFAPKLPTFFKTPFLISTYILIKNKQTKHALNCLYIYIYL